MALVKDERFREDLNTYWKVRNNVEDVLRTYFESVRDEDYILEATNIIKTSCVISYTYTECYNEVVKVIGPKIPLQYCIAKFVLGLVLTHILASGEYKYEYIPNGAVVAVESWDKYYYNLCNAVASNTKCFSRAVGTVLVRDKTIIGTGYNGPPRGIITCDQRWEMDKNLQHTYKQIYGEEYTFESVKGRCPRQVLGFKSGEGLDWCVAGHGERNALIQAAREGICTKHSTLYMNCAVPCTPCLVEIINAGVEEIVITEFKFYDRSSEYLIKNSPLKVRTYKF